MLTITGDSLANDLQITDAGGGNWAVSATVGGTTQFKLNGGPALPTAVFAAPATVKATLGIGSDRIDMLSLNLGGSLTINGNDGDDAVLLSGVSVTGAVVVDTGTGHDDLDLTSTQLANTTTVRMGTGDDYFTAGGDLTFGRGLSADLGSGANILDVNATSLQSNGNFSVLASGSSVETQGFLLAAASGQVTGAVTLRTTTASATVFQIGSVAGDDFRVTGGMTLQAGSGNDSVTLNQKIQTGGALNIQLSNGTNEVVTTDLDSLRVGGLTYGGGSGADTVTLAGNTVWVTGQLNFTGGAATNLLDLNPAVSLRVGGGLGYSGGINNDTLLIDGPDATIGALVRFSGSNGSNYLGFNAVLGSVGALTYYGGSGADVVDVGEFDGLTDLVTIRGTVSIGAGAGSADIMVRDAIVMGNLNVSTSVAFGGIDTVQILDSDVYGSTTLNLLGTADTDVVVRDSIFDRSVTVSTGGGDDYVAFDTDTAVSSIYSQFYGAVRVILGAGNDIFAAGSNPAVDTVGNDFYSYVDVNGGTGYDRAYFIHYDYNNGFNGPLPWTNAEEFY
ncbi:MAG: hypothetical protein U0984_18815 [Prosthecobacter sp.]|nr:hypothetical protein [Prosthecobacter sp.]